MELKNTRYGNVEVVKNVDTSKPKVIVDFIEYKGKEYELFWSDSEYGKLVAIKRK